MNQIVQTMKRIVRKVIMNVIIPGILMVLMTFTGCSQASDQVRKPAEKAVKPSPAGEADKIKDILSQYDPKSLNSEMAIQIHEKFRAAGIHPGPENKDAISAAGFDPDRLRDLAPPPGRPGEPSAGLSSEEGKLKLIEEKIIKPLELNSVQADTIKKAFSDFFSEMGKLRTVNDPNPPDRSLVEPLEKSRDKRIEKILTAEQFSKYKELEKTTRPPRPPREPQKNEK
jgi:hypothetical protein